MISGQQALRSIEQATAAIRGQESEFVALLRSADEDLARLRAERTGLFRQFAIVRLDVLQSEKIGTELASAERRALQLIADGKSALDTLSVRLGEAQAARQKAEEDRHSKAEEVTRILGELEELQARVEPQVRGSTEWIAQKGSADQAERIFLAADSKASGAEADRAAKGKPYENDPLFMYLWRRGFGTSQYASGYFVRFFDEKVAALVGYQGARANYAMLNEIPARLREHAERRRASLETERHKQLLIEQAGLAAAGSGEIEKRLEAARLALFEADGRLREADKVIESLDRARDKAIQTDDQSPYGQAVRILAEADSREPLGDLYRKAARTRSGDDDAMVRQIEGLDQRIAKAEQDRVSIRRKAQEVAQRRAEIEAQRAQFHRMGYDNPMAQFRNENVIAEVLGGIIQGAVQGAVLGNVLQGGYHERPRRADSGFGGGDGFNFPFPGGGGGWIDRGGGGFGGGGGGDGFTTGGSF
jgi:hypothetical protein